MNKLSKNKITIPVLIRRNKLDNLGLLKLAQVKKSDAVLEMQKALQEFGNYFQGHGYAIGSHTAAETPDGIWMNGTDSGLKGLSADVQKMLQEYATLKKEVRGDKDYELAYAAWQDYQSKVPKSYTELSDTTRDAKAKELEDLIRKLKNLMAPIQEGIVTFKSQQGATTTVIQGAVYDKLPQIIDLNDFSKTGPIEINSNVLTNVPTFFDYLKQSNAKILDKNNQPRDLVESDLPKLASYLFRRAREIKAAGESNPFYKVWKNYWTDVTAKLFKTLKGTPSAGTGTSAEKGRELGDGRAVSRPSDSKDAGKEGLQNGDKSGVDGTEDLGATDAQSKQKKLNDAKILNSIVKDLPLNNENINFGNVQRFLEKYKKFSFSDQMESIIDQTNTSIENAQDISGLASIPLGIDYRTLLQYVKLENVDNFLGNLFKIIIGVDQLITSIINIFGKRINIEMYMKDLNDQRNTGVAGNIYANNHNRVLLWQRYHGYGAGRASR